MRLGWLLIFPIAVACGSEEHTNPVPAEHSKASGSATVPLGEAASPDDGSHSRARKTRTATPPDEEPDEGRWRKAREYTPAADGSAAAENQELYQQLLALGYAEGTRVPTGQGITRHDSARAFEGYNFYTSAHDEVAVLMDMRGEILHEWRKSFADVIEGPPPMGEGNERRWWRRGWLMENGDIVALNTGMGVMRLDKDSNVLWVSPLYVHHDLFFREDGGYITLTREVHVVPRIHPTRPIVEDMVVYLDVNGEVERSFSILEAFERSPFKDAALADITRQMKRKGDLFHTNSIVELDGRFADRHPAFAKGNLLLSFRYLDAIGIVNPETKTMRWLHRSEFARQHDPKVLDNGNLLLFDNKGLGKASRILEIDPVTGETRWQYVGSDAEPFFTGTCGIADVLPNDNVLITESDNGRAFEVTRAGEIVWEFRSPHRAGEGDKFVATLPEVIRLPKDFPLDWLRE
jgi:outer membrane protein assembly factor BamB